MSDMDKILGEQVCLACGGKVQIDDMYFASGELCQTCHLRERDEWIRQAQQEGGTDE